MWPMAGADVIVRVHALLNPPSKSDRVAYALVLVLVGAGVLCSAASVLWLGHDLRNIVAVARY